MRRLVRVIENVTNIGGYFSGWLVPLMMLLVLVEVFMRYVLNQPLMVADEFSAYLLVALTFLGAAYTWKERGHVRIVVLISRLPQKVSSWVRLTALILSLVFTIMLVQAGYHFTAFSFRFNISSATWLHTPQHAPRITLLIGFILLALMLIVETAKAIVNLRAGKSVDEETAG